MAGLEEAASGLGAEPEVPELARSSTLGPESFFRMNDFSSSDCGSLFSLLQFGWQGCGICSSPSQARARWARRPSEAGPCRGISHAMPTCSLSKIRLGENPPIPPHPHTIPACAPTPSRTSCTPRHSNPLPAHFSQMEMMAIARNATVMIQLSPTTAFLSTVPGCPASVACCPRTAAGVARADERAWRAGIRGVPLTPCCRIPPSRPSHQHAATPLARQWPRLLPDPHPPNSTHWKW